MTSTTTSPSTSRRGAPSKIALVDLRLEDACQPRAKLHQETINEYAEYYTNGVKLPAIDVFQVGKKLVIVDGFHRFAAATKADVGFLRCRIVGRGTLEDATWYATSVNQAHGLRRSNADKRKAVRMALQSKTGSDQSNRGIAEHCGVHHDLVAVVRGELEAEVAVEEPDQLATVANSTAVVRGELEAEVADPPTETRKGRDGKRYPKRKTSKRKAVEVSSDDSSKPVIEVEDVADPSDRYVKIAGMIKALRRQIRQFGADQKIDRHLEDAQRAADDCVLIDCPQCDGGGCKLCHKGRATKGAARLAKDKARGRKIAAKAAVNVRAAAARAE